MSDLPAFIPPMLATLVAAPFDDTDWSFEVKWDGFRVEAVVAGDEVRLWTRGQQDAARYFGPFLEPPTWISARQAIVDGEVIALDDSGEPDFALLQAQIKGQRSGGAVNPFVYEVFDLLFLDGRSLLDEPLEERRRLLGDVLRLDPRVRLSEDITGEGTAFFEAARVRGLEGIMAKDRRSTYLPGKRSMAWQKIKIRPEQELVVGGWARGTGTAVDLGALLVGVYEDGAFGMPARSVPGSRPAFASNCSLRSSRWPSTSHRSPRRSRAPRHGTRCGFARSSSSAPSSPAGPATVSSARQPIRASTSRRTRAPSAARRPPRDLFLHGGQEQLA